MGSQGQLIQHTDKTFVYYCNAAGDIIPAPDTRMSVAQSGMNPFVWRKCEAHGAKEIERVSLIMAEQAFNKKKQMTAGQHLREKASLDQLKVRAKLRIAQAFSEHDVRRNKQILAMAEARENKLLRVITSEFDPSKRTTALSIELEEESTSKLRQFGKKKVGIS
jgi:hypothetical protein